MQIKRILVVGLGLIGGSFAKACHQKGFDVLGIDPVMPTDADFLVYAQTVPVLLEGADLVVLALPPKQVVPWVMANAPFIAPGTVVIDLTGVKGVICKALEKFAFQTRWTFIGAHPMAGKEVNGWANATASLWQGASMIFTPYPSCGRGPLDALKLLCEQLGFARVVFTSPQHHDEMIALTSQLAHVVSSAYVQDPLALEHVGYSAGSFHDMTRVALLDPATWSDLFLANQSSLLLALDGLIYRLGEYRSALAANNVDYLQQLLAAGRVARLEIMNKASQASDTNQDGK